MRGLGIPLPRPSLILLLLLLLPLLLFLSHPPSYCPKHVSSHREKRRQRPEEGVQQASSLALPMVEAVKMATTERLQSLKPSLLQQQLLLDKKNSWWRFHQPPRLQQPFGLASLLLLLLLLLLPGKEISSWSTCAFVLHAHY